MFDEPERPWRKLLRDDQLRAGEMRVARLGVRQVLVARTRYGLRVFRNTCPHAGAPLSGGTLSDTHLRCPRHRWDFRLEDGSCPEHPLYRLRAHDVRVEDGWIFAQEAEEEIW